MKLSLFLFVRSKTSIGKKVEIGLKEAQRVRWPQSAARKSAAKIRAEILAWSNHHLPTALGKHSPKKGWEILVGHSTEPVNQNGVTVNFHFPRKFTFEVLINMALQSTIFIDLP